jgi:hypothetical protein
MAAFQFQDRSLAFWKMKNAANHSRTHRCNMARWSTQPFAAPSHKATSRHAVHAARLLATDALSKWLGLAVAFRDGIQNIWQKNVL